MKMKMKINRVDEIRGQYLFVFDDGTLVTYKGTPGKKPSLFSINNGWKYVFVVKNGKITHQDKSFSRPQAESYYRQVLVHFGVTVRSTHGLTASLAFAA